MVSFLSGFIVNEMDDFSPLVEKTENTHVTYDNINNK